MILYAELTLKLCLLVFMVGSMGAMGFDLPFHDAVAALRNLRFVALTLLIGFVLSPAIAYLIVRLLPLEAPYAMGLLLLGMAPSAPFMPLMVRKANGEFGHTAALMFLAAVCTVVFMPVAAPLLISGLSANAWTIGRPLLLFILMPLAIGSTVRHISPLIASRCSPLVKRITGIATVLMLALTLVIYGKRFLGLVGTYAIAAQILFVAVVTFFAFWLGSGLKEEQRSVLTIGMCTRNIGAAFAPLMTAGTDARAIVMVAFAVPVTLLASYVAASWLARHTHSPINVGGIRSQVAGSQER